MSEKAPQLPLPELSVPHQGLDFEQQATERQFAGEMAVRGLRRLFKRHQSEPLQAEVIEAVPQDSTKSSENRLETAPLAENYVFLNELLTPESLQEQKSRLLASIEADPVLSAFGLVYEANLENGREWNEAHRSGDSDRARLLDVQAADLRAEIESYESSVTNNYVKISESIRQIDKHSTYVVETESEQGQALLQTLQTASPAKEKDSSAPFANYAQNIGESWRAVSKEEVIDYLSKKEFKQHTHPENGAVILDSKEGEPFEVPLDLINNASGFDDWQGRKGSSKSWQSDFGSGNMASLDVIKHYAALPTELPPVGEIRVMISPDGKISCDNGSGDSHRISAAILRGETTIKANKLQFVRLAEN